MLEASESTMKDSLKNIKRQNKKPQTREFCNIQPIDEWVERRRRECDEHVTRMDAERLVKISGDHIPEEDLQNALIEDGVT